MGFVASVVGCAGLGLVRGSVGFLMRLSEEPYKESCGLGLGAFGCLQFMLSGLGVQASDIGSGFLWGSSLFSLGRRLCVGFGAIQMLKMKRLCTEFTRLSSYRLTQEKSSASPPRHVH